jgi:hypothetical protein
VTVTEEGRAALKHGRDLGASVLVDGFPRAPAARLRVVDDSGALLALATPRALPVGSELRADPVLHPDVVLI